MGKVNKNLTLNLTITFMSLVIIMALGIFFSTVVHAASGPYNVPSFMKTYWAKNYGGKRYPMTSGDDLVYDVYSKKYTKGGYQIVNKNFGKGTQSYLNFQGWAVLFGFANEYKSNNETYIVAQKVSGSSGVGTTKIYSTSKINISATEDLEYNNQGSGLYHPCSDSERDKNNTTCNMKYQDVGFNAYIPLNELFPKKYEKAEWKLYIVKKVDKHIVYTRLILPFKFADQSYNGGKISLSSGVSANHLIMNSPGVLRRAYPRQSAPSVTNQLGSDRYFSIGDIYTRVDSEESRTAVWYGVRSSKDGGKTKWATTAYWTFGGSQAVISYTPPPDDAPPIPILHQLLDYQYKNGNDYWVQPNHRVYIRLEQRDVYSGNQYQYLRLLGSGQDVRSLHKFSSGKTNNNPFDKSRYVVIHSAYREKNTSYGQVKWGVIPKRHGDDFNVQYYYEDNAGNHIGYNDTGMNLRVDGVAPKYVSAKLSNYRYKNGNDYWVRPNDQVDIELTQRDADSGNKYQYLRLDGSGTDVRSQHNFHKSSANNNRFMKSSHVSIASAHREENTSYGEVKWGIRPKKSGDSYNILYYFRDNVDNSRGYNDTGMNLRVDGVAPEVQFRNGADTSNFHNRNWSNGKIEVRLKFHDSGSGYGRSRYAWTQSTQTPSSWSKWTSRSNYVVTKSRYGQWYLHVQTEDHVGNVRTIYQGPYKFDNPPVANFVFQPPSSLPSGSFEGEDIQLVNQSTDADGDKLTANWKIVSPSGQIERSTNWNAMILNAEPGNYSVQLTVTDPHGESDQVIKQLSAEPLNITGQVLHTSDWQKIHQAFKTPSKGFYSGEKFVLHATVTNYPIDPSYGVEVDFAGNQMNGNDLILSEKLTKKNNTLFTGVLYDTSMSDPATRLTNGPVIFKFSVHYKNGVVKTDYIAVNIIGSVYKVFHYHRTY